MQPRAIGGTDCLRLDIRIRLVGQVPSLLVRLLRGLLIGVEELELDLWIWLVVRLEKGEWTVQIKIGYQVTRDNSARGYTTLRTRRG